MTSANVVTSAVRGKPALYLLSMQDDDNGAFDCWLFRERSNALAFFGTAATQEAAKGRFRPDPEDADGDDSPRTSIPDITQWLSDHGTWCYTEAIKWRLDERVVEDAMPDVAGTPEFGRNATNQPRKCSMALRLYLNTWTVGEDDAPPYAWVDLTPQFIDRLESLRAAARREGVPAVSAGVTVGWHDPDGDSRFEMTGDELVVGKTDWHLRASPANAGYVVETDHVPFEDMRRLMDEAAGQGKGYIGYATDAEGRRAWGFLDEAEAAA